MTANHSNQAGSVSAPTPSASSPRGKAATQVLPPLLDDSFGQMSWKAVYTIVDRGPNKRHFVRIGVAFVNRDLSLNVRLDAMPINGQLHIRDAPPRDGQSSADHFLSDRDRDRDRPKEMIAPF